MFDFKITWKALEEKNLKQMGNNNFVVFYKVFKDWVRLLKLEIDYIFKKICTKAQLRWTLFEKLNVSAWICLDILMNFIAKNYVCIVAETKDTYKCTMNSLLFT